MATRDENLLGTFLKARRAKIDPAELGFRAGRRRTPGLRREEVAQRAEISATWYTWLEQGRGGAPSAEVLERLAAALLLTAAEREHLFLLAQHRPPEVRYQPPAAVPPQLQGMIDALELCPALVKTSSWDILAWNRAAAAVLTDYGALPPARRNLLRLLFSRERVAAQTPHWESHARLAVATFRLASARAGAGETAAALVDELSASSPEFAAMWREHEVRSYGEGTKQIDHPVAGTLSLVYSSFSVDDQPDLGLVVYTPATAGDAERIRSILPARNDGHLPMESVRVVAAIPV